MHGQAEQRREHADFDHDPEDRRRGSLPDRRLRVGAARIQLHDARGVGDCFHARKRKHNADEARPVIPETAVQRLKISDRGAEMRQAEEPERHHHDRSWHRNEERESAGVFWA